MGPGRNLDVLSDLRIAGDRAVMRPVQPDNLGQQMNRPEFDAASF